MHLPWQGQARQAALEERTAAGDGGVGRGRTSPTRGVGKQSQPGGAGEVLFLWSAEEGAFLPLFLPSTCDTRYGFKVVGSPGSLHTPIYPQGL